MACTTWYLILLDIILWVHVTNKQFDMIRIFLIRYIVHYTNIDLKLRNKLHGPMHYKIGVICVFSGHKMNTLL